MGKEEHSSADHRRYSRTKMVMGGLEREERNGSCQTMTTLVYHVKGPSLSPSGDGIF